MIRLKISEDKIIRLKKFLDSENFQNSYSKSEMWKEFTRSSKIAFEKNFVILQGDSGLYFRNLNFFKKFISKFKNLIVNYNKLPIFLSYKQAFELVMQNQQARGKKQLNFNQKPFHKIFKNFDEILEDKPFKSYNFDYYETKHYYLFNVLRTYIDFNKLNNVLEIGGGSGHFLTLITNYHSNIKSYINVDLPETIIFSICFTMNFFPNEDICLPNEANTENILKNKFTFLTPNQIDFIKDETVDLSINTASFAEMTKKDIEIYFELIQRVSNNGGYFLNHNRVHKNPEGKDEEINKNLEPNFFSEYPYKNNEVIIYDICRLVQLLEKDPFMLRLEKIIK